MNLRFLALASLVGVGAVANADIVMDQLPRTGQDAVNVYASQVFEAANAAFTIKAIDDFTVDASQLNVVNIKAHMGGWAGFVDANWSDPTIVRGFRVGVFASIADAANDNAIGGYVVVDHADADIMAGFGLPNFDRLVSLDVNIMLPGAGTYWVGVSGLLDFTPGGQMGVYNSVWSGNDPGGLNAWQANPGAGFGWTSQQIDPPVDLAYSVEAVPEPATLLALGAGAAALIARRRRNAA